VTAHEDLTAALVALLDDDDRPPCCWPDVAPWWLSEDRATRARAAEHCHGCAILDRCHAAAELKPSEGLAADVRRQLVGMLSAQGMSTRAIAPTVGRDSSVIRRDLQVVQLAPPAEPESVSDPAPAKVVGLDGKAYTRPEKPSETAARAYDAAAVHLYALAGLPESAHLGLGDQRAVARMFAPGTILPAGVRPDVLEHLERSGLALAVHVPITDTTEEN